MSQTKYKQKYFTLEHRNEKPLPTHMFVGRLARYFVGSTSLVIFALGIGILRYHILENFSLTDSFLNASMILGGMGPVNELRTETGKLFAGLYALFSGLIFLVAVSLVIAPCSIASFIDSISRISKLELKSKVCLHNII